MSIANKKHLIVLSSPSGGGKSTVTRYLLKTFPFLRFSVSATTRPQRPKELYGRDYYFLKKEEFQKRIERGEFIEYEEIFGNYYGTLKKEIDKAINNDKFLIFDVDVKGALSLKKAYPDETLLIFLIPVDIEVLRYRLLHRQTESNEQINRRLERAEMEMSLKVDFDYIIVNDVLDETLMAVEELVKKFTM